MKLDILLTKITSWHQILLRFPATELKHSFVFCVGSFFLSVAANVASAEYIPIINESNFTNNSRTYEVAIYSKEKRRFLQYYNSQIMIDYDDDTIGRSSIDEVDINTHFEDKYIFRMTAFKVWDYDDIYYYAFIKLKNGVSFGPVPYSSSSKGRLTTLLPIIDEENDEEIIYYLERRFDGDFWLIMNSFIPYDHDSERYYWATYDKIGVENKFIINPYAPDADTDRKYYQILILSEL